MFLPIALALLQFAVPATPPLPKPVRDSRTVVESVEPAKAGAAAQAEQVSQRPAADEAAFRGPQPAAAESETTSSAGSGTAGAAPVVAEAGAATGAEGEPAGIDAPVLAATGPASTDAALPGVAAESSSRDLAPAGIPGAAPAPAAPILSTAELTDEQSRWNRQQKRIWLCLSIAQSSAAAFDGWSTRQVVGSGRGTELNPMLRPFSGNASLYATIEVGPMVIDYLARRMLNSHRSWARHTWWIPQVTGTVVSLVSGARNMGVYNGE